MYRKLQRGVFGIVASWVAGAVSVAAEPVRLFAHVDVFSQRTTAPFVTVTSGAVFSPDAQLLLRLQGLDNGPLDPASSSWRTPMPCIGQTECVPGQRVNFSNELSLRVPIVPYSIIDGVERTWWEAPQLALEGTLRFLMDDITLPLTAPVIDEANGPLFNVSEPYRFTGEMRLVGPDIGDRSFEVFGRGFANASGLIGAIRPPDGRPWAEQPGVAFVDGVNFAPAPVPEPSTLILFGTGAAALVRAARKRRG